MPTYKLLRLRLNASGGTDAIDTIDVPAGGNPAWGAITGTLAGQADLQTALNAKQASGQYATGTGSASGVNTGDQSTVTGNAGTATTLQTARNINGVSFNGSANIAVTASFPSTGGGYTSGAGGTVTQLTSKATGVTLNKICGQITTHNAALAAAAEVKFTVTNNTVAATDIPVLAIASGGTSGSYGIFATAVAAGSFDVTLTNLSAGSLSQALVVNFAVIKSVSA